MEYSFRPQWRTWTFYSRRNPMCVRCGLQNHRFGTCSAIDKQCFKCNKLGHYSRQCWSTSCQTSNCLQLFQKTNRKKQCDNKRLNEYFERKNAMRELPFSFIRSTSFQNCLDVSVILCYELKSVKSHLQECKVAHRKDITKLQYQLSEFKRENTSLQKQIEDSAIQDSKTIKQYSDKIIQLESKLSDSENFVNIKTGLNKQTQSWITEQEEKHKTEKDRLIWRNDELYKTIQILSDENNRLKLIQQQTNNQSANSNKHSRENRHYRRR
ncbi:unnamed protein product [Mytilus coruscus]|uniref:CCHC-type domain-containing protein n=1 Tax=Mytilus coruscus TaxID=42192 RepID=A0A6J8CSS4_MYTCO|nr:unnamed protein product [Mytilus coruscus]